MEIKMTRKCVICEKDFEVKMNKKGRILTDCFYNRLDLNYFEGWSYILNRGKKELNIDDLKIEFKNKLWELLGFCKLTREIIYFFWKIFHKKAWFEYWECPECANREDDI